jgi:Tfp pilus assembly protein PilX
MTPKPMTLKSKNNANSKKGFALLIAIFILLLLTAIGAGMVTLTNTDTSISANFRDEQSAYFGAKAGIEEVRDRFRSGASNTLSTNTYFSTSNLPGGTNGVLYITNPGVGDTVTPWVTNGAATVYPDNEICTELANLGTACGTSGPTGSWYLTTSASTAYAPTTGTTLPWKWARITAKTNLTSSGTSSSGSSLASVDGNLAHTNYRVCWNGANEVAIPNTTSCAGYGATPPYQPVYVITALAQTPSGSRRMVQAEATMTSFPSIPGPLVFDGPNPTFSTPSSNAFQVNANNFSSPTNTNGPGASCPSGQPSEYAIGGFDTTSTNLLQTWTNANRPNNYVGINNPTGTTGIGSVGNVSSQLGSLATVGGLQALTSEVTLIAGNEGNVYTTNQSGLTNPGTIANPQVNVVEGNLTLSGSLSGAGILLVTGTLTMNGNPSYDGLILVVGKGAVIKNGGGNGTVDGAMLVANLYNSSGALLPSSGPPGSPSVTWNGGGTVKWNYDSCWSTAMSQSLAWRIVAMREIIR